MRFLFSCSILGKEAAKLRKLKRYKPTKFMAEGSRYDKEAADAAVTFINCRCLHCSPLIDSLSAGCAAEEKAICITEQTVFRLIPCFEQTGKDFHRHHSPIILFINNSLTSNFTYVILHM
jgi:hypothetical protein